MFDKFFKSVKSFFTAEPLKTQFEEMVLQEAAKEAEKATPAEVKPEPVVAQATASSVNDQITDAVTQAPAKPKRARTAKGKLKADDPATPEVNEAWEGDKAPEKKPRAPRKKKEVK